MIVNEIFYSLQGEGFLTGTPSVFIRLSGCPLRCRWCDTKYAWDNNAGENLSIDSIVQSLRQYRTGFVVITGGEPMLNAQLPPLVKALKNADKHITIETSGIAFVPDLPCDLVSISPKLSNSVPDEPNLAEIHENSRLNLAVLGELIDHYKYQIKFVVDTEDDLAEIEQTLKQLVNVDTDRVILMPQAATRQKLLEKSQVVAQMCKKSGFVFGQRLQILLWDNKKGV
jgi:7-carboxy-7-deazaguanine synthase